MADIYNIKAPITNPVSLALPKSWHPNRASLKKAMVRTWANYGKYFKNVAEATGLPVELLLAFAMVESGGRADIVSSGSDNIVGLMQWDRRYASGLNNTDMILSREYLKNRLSDREKEILASYGVTFNAKGGSRPLTKEDQMKPELNLLVGAIVLNQYLDQPWAKDANGDVRLDRILTRYNWGPGGFDAKGIATKDMTNVFNSVPAESKGYMHKLLGKDGSLDIAINDKQDFA